ncbi:hypothetical protein Tco_0973953 [Tanacetum coccineum]|uniref:Uncharacterized protein n=1 Tax=Tanacetum coccineum TaxID=301880 RepID=A0ABQ5EAC4_9ASTR
MYSMILYLVQCESLCRIPVFSPLTRCDRLVIRAKVMSTPAYVDLETITQADGAQSSLVPVHLPDDPYVAVRQAQLVDTDIESNPEEAPSRAEDSQPLGSRVPLMSEEFEASEPSSTRTVSSNSLVLSDSTTPLSPDHPLTHVSPTPTPTRVSYHRMIARMTVHVQPAMSPGHSTKVAEAMALSDSAFRKRYRSSYETPSSSSSLTLPVQKRYRGTSEVILDTDSKGDELGEDNTEEDVEDESHGLDDESHGLDDESQGLDDESQGLDDEEEEEEAALEGQQQAVPVVDTSASEPLGLGYRAARHRALESTEEIAPSTYEPTLVAWVDPEDGRVYTDIPTYAPPAAPVQTPPSPEWSSCSLPISPSSPVVPSPIALLVATTTAIISVDEDHFWRFRSLEREQERATVTFGALWRPVLALEAWVGHVDTRMADMSRDRYDDHRLIHDMLVQQAAMQRELQEMKGRVTALEQERGHRES